MKRLQRLTLILFAAVVVNLILEDAVGYQIVGGDLLFVLFVISLSILLIRWMRMLSRKLLWRLRNRLIVSYVLFGVVPLVLIVCMTVIGAMVLFGQIGANMVRDEIDRKTDLVYSAARDTALGALYGSRELLQDIPQRLPRLRTVVISGNKPVPAPSDGLLTEIPAWMPAGFKGIVRDRSHIMIAAGAQAEASGRSVRVLAYIPIDNGLLAEFNPELGAVSLLNAPDESFIRNPQDPQIRLVPVETSGQVAAARGIWDVPVGWPILFSARNWNTGNPDRVFMSVFSRLSLIIPHLFRNLGRGMPILGIVFVVIAAVFLFVEIISLIISVNLTRTITRSINDLYIGTKHVAKADFSHRIPVRTTDQLSELALSFNGMTDRIQQLVQEVKEKEKLESELEIAREVQSQLFPKNVPKLKTLELAGVCNPARVVSGDYYDFLPVNCRMTAIAIGDIAGKGISAALLMASVQSAMHAQLTAIQETDGESPSNFALSTATLVTRLNRQLYESTSPEKYATFYCAVYDDESGQLAYTNAGHLPPILVRQGKTSRLEVNGMVVGIMPDVVYGQSAIDLQPGDLLAAVTTGSRNPKIRLVNSSAKNAWRTF